MNRASYLQGRKNVKTALPSYLIVISGFCNRHKGLLRENKFSANAIEIDVSG